MWRKRIARCSRPAALRLYPSKPISKDELARVEDIANRTVLDNTPVVTRLMGINEAIGTGARALFGEKYTDEVRVVSMGQAHANEDGLATLRNWLFNGFAAEPVSRTGDIGIITIVSETSVAAGVRRIEAKTATERAAISTRAHQCMTSRRCWLPKRRRTNAWRASSRRAGSLNAIDRCAGNSRWVGTRRETQPTQEIGGVKFLGASYPDRDEGSQIAADEAKLSVAPALSRLLASAATGRAGIVVGVTPV
jgi:alanyl-tRNA synthetase